MKRVALIGYSGHAFVVADTLLSLGINLLGYFEQKKKESNPFNLPYIGQEEDEKNLEILKEKDTFFFACVGNNRIRSKIIKTMLGSGFQTLVAAHPGSFISEFSSVGEGTLAAPGCRVNALANVGRGVILNTGSIVEHECIIKDFAHIAPGAVLAGNVLIGESSFVGANAVIKEGITIGKNVTIGAGSVIIKDIPDNEMWVGNPGKKLDKNEK